MGASSCPDESHLPPTGATDVEFCRPSFVRSSLRHRPRGSCGCPAHDRIVVDAGTLSPVRLKAPRAGRRQSAAAQLVPKQHSPAFSGGGLRQWPLYAGMIEPALHVQGPAGSPHGSGRPSTAKWPPQAQIRSRFLGPPSDHWNGSASWRFPSGILPLEAGNLRCREPLTRPGSSHPTEVQAGLRAPG